MQRLYMMLQGKTIQDQMRYAILTRSVEGKQNDVRFPLSFLSSLKNCENCSAQYNWEELMQSSDYKACECAFCHQSVVKDVYFCFPEGIDHPYMSLAKTYEELIRIESERD